MILVASFVSWCLQPFLNWLHQTLLQTPSRMLQSRVARPRDETDETVSNVHKIDLLRRFQESFIFWFKKGQKKQWAMRNQKMRSDKPEPREFHGRPPCNLQQFKKQSRGGAPRNAPRVAPRQVPHGCRQAMRHVACHDKLRVAAAMHENAWCEPPRHAPCPRHVAVCVAARHAHMRCVVGRVAPFVSWPYAIGATRPTTLPRRRLSSHVAVRD